jgi:hypothetical protein
MADDRSERLRRRRNRSNRRAARDGETAGGQRDGDADAAGSDGTGGADDPENPEDADDGTEPVKEERTGMYMYLPDDQLKEIKRLYNMLKAEYEFEFDEKFEKNRHFYPLVVRCGLEGLAEMDISEIRDELRRL